MPISPNGSSESTLTPTQWVKRALSSVLVDRFSFSRSAGLSFGGKRDSWLALGYPDHIIPHEYRAQYERGGIAERLIEHFPKATWANGANIVENPDPKVETPWEKEVDLLFTRLNMFSRILRADILAGLGRYSVILIGVNDQKSLDTELTRVNGPDDIIYLGSYSEERVSDLSMDKNTSSPRFNQPLRYMLKISATVILPVHWSRIIHVAEGLLEDETFGKPRLRAIWNNLIDLLKITGGGSEAVWNNADPLKHISIDPETQFGKPEQDLLEGEIDEIEHKLRRWFRTRGGKVKLLSGGVEDFSNNAKMIIALMSATTGIPQRIFLGSERGSLASEQDRDNEADRNQERRLLFGTPLLRKIVDRFSEINALSTAPDYDVVWPRIETLNEKGKAEVAELNAKANKAQVESGAGIITTSDEIRDSVHSLDPLIQATPQSDNNGQD